MKSNPPFHHTVSRAFRTWAVMGTLSLAFIWGGVRQAPALSQGEIMGTFLAETLDGPKVELAAFRNYRLLIIDFWATWSPPSIAQHHQIREGLRDLSGVVWISVSLDRDVAAARAFFDRNPGPSIRVCDGLGFDSPWAGVFDVVSAPTTYIIDLDGIVRTRLTDIGGQEGVRQRIIEARRPPREVEAMNEAAAGRIVRPDVVEVNKLAPEFRLRDIRAGGRPLRLQDYDGKVLLIVLFASWNAESTSYLMEVASVFERTRQFGFELIAVSIENDDRPVRLWLDSSAVNIRFPVAVQRPDDPESITFRKYPFDRNLPWSFLIGRNGLVRDLGKIGIPRLRQVLVEDLNIRL